jgi:hypothetical protein
MTKIFELESILYFLILETGTFLTAEPVFKGSDEVFGLPDTH